MGTFFPMLVYPLSYQFVPDVVLQDFYLQLFAVLNGIDEILAFYSVKLAAQFSTLMILIAFTLANGDERSYSFWENPSQCCSWYIRCLQWCGQFYLSRLSPHVQYPVVIPMTTITGGLVFAMLGATTPTSMFVFAAIYGFFSGACEYLTSHLFAAKILTTSLD